MKGLLGSFSLLSIGIIGFSIAQAQPSLSDQPSEARSATNFRRPLDLTINTLSPDESITVYGKKRHFMTAPMPTWGGDRTPWEEAGVHHDSQTGADISSFGNAYSIGNPLGSDERSNETGGTLLAQRHN